MRRPWLATVGQTTFQPFGYPGGRRLTARDVSRHILYTVLIDVKMKPQAACVDTELMLSTYHL